MTQSSNSIKGVLSQTNFMKLMIANFINRFGDSIEVIALSWLVYNITGKAAWSATVVAFNYLPTVVLQFFVGPIVEKMNKRNVMAIADIIRGTFTIILIALYLSNKLTPYMLIAYTLFNSSIECFRVPSGTSIIPAITNEESYNSCISVSQATNSISELVGLGIAGIIIACFSIYTALLINAVTFFLSAILIFAIKLKSSTTNPHKGDSYMHLLKDGIKYMYSNKVFMSICLFAVLFNGLTMVFESMQSPITYELFHGDPFLLSLLSTGFTLGMFLGSIVFIRIIKIFTVRNIMIISSIFTGIMYILFGVVPGFLSLMITKYLIAFIFSACLGFVTGIKSITIRTSLLKAVDPKYLSRTTSLFNSAAMLICPVSCFIQAGLVNFVGLSSLIIFNGVLCIIAGFIIIIGKLKFTNENI